MRVANWIPSVAIAGVTFALALLALYLAQIDRQSDLAYNLVWAQPHPISDMRPVSPTSWSFDFAPAGDILQRANIEPDGGLKVDADLADVLKASINALPDHLDADNLERVGLLAEKVLVGGAGETLSQLVLSYYRYQQAARAGQHQAGAIDAQSALARDIALRQQFFGEPDMQALFGRELLLKSYLLSRREINEDASLSREEKKVRLAALNAEFDQILPAKE